MVLEDISAYYAPKDLILFGLLHGEQNQTADLNLLHKKLHNIPKN